jgi:hypothetical protein
MNTQENTNSNAKWYEVTTYDYYQARTKKSGEHCYIVEFDCVGGKTFKKWLLVDRRDKWGKQARTWVDMMKTSRITNILVEDENAKFPNIIDCKFDQLGEVIEEIENPYLTYKEKYFL